MKTDFTDSWKASKQPRKQRKYLYNLPLHKRGKLMNVTLSKDLKKKYSRNSVRLKKGDRVKVMRGQFKGETGNVESIDVGRTKVMISKIEVTKKDGTKRPYPFHPSNLTIEDLELSDKKRIKSNAKKAEQPKEEKNETAS